MIRPSKFFVFLLAVALFVACVVALMGVDCGSNVGCTVSKFVLGYLLIGLVVTFTGFLVWSYSALVATLVLTPIPTFPAVSVPRTIFARSPPVQF